MTQIAPARLFPMKKPAHHNPVIQRYSSQFPETASSIRTATLGFQGKAESEDNLQKFTYFIDSIFTKTGKPNHHDIANFVDTRALVERAKYQENLELLTYHEIYVLNDSVRFEYINCHPDTGLMPFFTNNAT